VSVETRDHGRIAELDQPRVQGVVYDSIRSVPLQGASVFVLGTGHETRTDAGGRFSLQTAPGDYSLAFHHPRVDSLGFQPPPVPVHMRAGVVREVRLSLPGPATLLRFECGARPGEGVVAGTVSDHAGAPAPNARVELTWRSGDEGVRRIEARSGADGRYVFCRAPVGPDLFARAYLPDRASSPEPAALVDDAAHDVDLRLADVPPGRVAGRVVDAESGAAVAQAAVRVEGTAIQSLSDDRGRFALANVPPGAQRLEVTHLAFGTHTDSVRVPPDSTLQLTVSMTAAAIALEPLTVTAERQPLTPGLAGFYDRMDRGIGFFITKQQILGRQARSMNEVLRAVPGLTVTCGTPDVMDSGCLMQFERARTMDTTGRERVCPVQYFLDGTRTALEIIETLRPDEIEGV
jgi:hypothetical protein